MHLNMSRTIENTFLRQWKRVKLARDLNIKISIDIPMLAGTARLAMITEPAFERKLKS